MLVVGCNQPLVLWCLLREGAGGKTRQVSFFQLGGVCFGKSFCQAVRNQRLEVRFWNTCSLWWRLSCFFCCRILNWRSLKAVAASNILNQMVRKLVSEESFSLGMVTMPFCDVLCVFLIAGSGDFVAKSLLQVLGEVLELLCKSNLTIEQALYQPLICEVGFSAFQHHCACQEWAPWSETRWSMKWPKQLHKKERGPWIYSLLAKIMKLHMEKHPIHKIHISFTLIFWGLDLGTPGRFRRSQPRTTSTNFWSVVSLVPLLPKLA